MPITELLERNAQLYPSETAIIEINPEHENSVALTSWTEFALVDINYQENTYRRELSWMDFDCRANRFAHLLLANGVQKGDKVGILMMNCLEWLPVYFGVLKAGALAVPLNYRYTAEEIRYCLELADCSLLVFGNEFVGRISEIKEALTKIKKLYYVGSVCPDWAESYYTFMSYCSSRKPHIDISDEDFGAIYFSSGTTGFPKAILHKHRSLSHAAIAEQKHHGQKHGDCFLCMPPLYHTGAKMHWFGSLLSGSKAVILRGISPKWILQTAAQEHATNVWLLVPWAQDILDALDRGELSLSDYDLSKWTLMHIGAQPVPPALINRWKAYFPNHQYDTNYGLSESIGPGCVHLGIENTHKVGAIGIAGYGWETMVVDSDKKEVPQGEVGELAVRGPGVMTCYYKNEEATRESLSPDGWLWTGDMARVDEDGFIWLVDRKKDVIIMGGENLYPVQIEDFLRKNGKIKDVAVIGRPHPRLGEIACAIIELKQGVTATEDEINEFCLELPRYKRPREIIFDKIPRNPTGKIEKPLLRKKYGSTDIVSLQTGTAN
ncbi:MAG: class I adenylate-forming enzyme family protein [Oscillospiraceae bacterium]|nr:class I adenylate-forming enzyme family protein [Oscillospiraceae bacterium]